MMSEIFPANVRGMASSVATLLNWTFSFVITKTFTNMVDAISEEGVSRSCCGAGGCVCWSAGVSPEEVVRSHRSAGS